MHFVKATVTTRIKGDSDVRDYVEDVVLQAEGGTPAGTVSRLRMAAEKVKRRFSDVGEVLNRAKEHILFRAWRL